MKILHCADLHLDSPMETHLSADKAQKRNQEVLDTFRRMTQYAAQNGVRLVLIAGDFFDGHRTKKRTAEIVLDAMRATPAVDYLYLTGNHDDRNTVFWGRDLPENLRLFSDQWQTLVYEDVAISGIEMTDGNAETLYDNIPVRQGCKNIVMLHGQVGTASGVDKVNLKLLKNRGIDYLALGHIHSYQCEQLDENGLWCYCGCPEGRGFDECGPKGFVLLDTDAACLAPAFVPFCTRQLHRVPVDVTGCRTVSDACNAIRSASAGISAGDMVEFILTGSVDTGADLSRQYLQNMIAQDFFFSKIKVETRLAIDPRDYANDVSLKGEFIRLVLGSSASEDEKAELIRVGLEALAGEDITL